MTRNKIILGFSALLAAVGLVFVGMFIAGTLADKNNPVPPTVASKIDFSPLVIPSDSPVKSSEYAASTVEDGTRLLSYTITLGSRTIKVSQYPQPAQFSDVPDFKTKFLEDVIQQTSSVSSSGGTIYLGRMAKQQNKQMAVMLERGLVVFLAPNEALTESQWRSIGDELTLVKIRN